MFARSLACLAFVLTAAAVTAPAHADQTIPAWNHGADKKMTQQPALTIAPILPIFPGSLDFAKLSNGAKLVPFGDYRDLHDGKGTLIARFDASGRTLEPLERPVNLVVTGSTVVFLGAKNAPLMTLPRPKH